MLFLTLSLGPHPSALLDQLPLLRYIKREQFVLVLKAPLDPFPFLPIVSPFSVKMSTLPQCQSLPQTS